MLEFQFLVGFAGKTKSLKTITSYFRGLSNFKRFHQKHKNALFWEYITVMLMKIKAASIHTGAGNHREMKGGIKILSAVMNFCEMNWQHPKQQTLTLAKQNTDEKKSGVGVGIATVTKKRNGAAPSSIVLHPHPPTYSPVFPLPLSAFSSPLSHLL